MDRLNNLKQKVETKKEVRMLRMARDWYIDLKLAYVNQN